MRAFVIGVLATLLPAAFCATVRGEETILLPLQRLSLPAQALVPDPNTLTNQLTNASAWQSSVGLGFSMTRGNSDNTLLTAKWQSRWRSELNEWLLGASGIYGENDSVKNRELLHGYGQFNHFFNPRLYDFGRVDGLHDGIKDIRYRFTGSVGLGYYLVQRTNLTLTVEAGPSVVTEKEGDDQSETYAAGRFAGRFEYKFGPGTRLWQSAEIIPQVDRMANYIVNAEVGIETTVARDLLLQVFLQNNYVHLPAPDYKHNDLRLISGLAYKF
jgi:putative salt-induced outer membrane protein YdiY